MTPASAYTNSLILAMALVAGMLLPSQSAQAQVFVRVAKVERESMQQRQAVTGSLRAVARGEVAALESGELRELTVREGESVSQGDIVARIDARRLEAEKAAAEAEHGVAQAELARGKATLTQTKADLYRTEQMVARGALTQQELDAAVAAHDVAAADIEAAQRRIQRIEETIRLLDVRLADTVIRAPYDASVVTRHVEPGDWVQAGEPLLTVVSTGPIEAWLEVPERFVEVLEQYGDNVVVRSRATGHDSRVLSTKRVNQVNPRVRTLHFVALLENADGLLADGMSVDGWIAVTGEIETDSVPKDAVIRTGTQPFVYRVEQQQEEAKAERVPVQILFETPERVAIAAVGLQPGDQVIVEGNERLLPGQQVAVTQTAESMTASSGR